MLKSMTGFGRGEYIDAKHRFIVEIKAVNHRYNEIFIRIPKALNSLEDKVRRMVSSNLARGRIDIFITFDEYVSQNKTVRVDKELALAYHQALKELGVLLNLDYNDNIYNLSRYPDVLKVEETVTDTSLFWPHLSEAVEQALESITSMRLAEGANIQKDMFDRIEKIASLVKFIEDRAPKITEEYRERLFVKIREVLENIGVEPDNVRILQEAAIYADKTNITEELVRLNSHLGQFKATLLAADTVGRKLDFIVQEINRETNTIAAKSNDADIVNNMLEIKSEIEKVREQIQNIE